MDRADRASSEGFGDWGRSNNNRGGGGGHYSAFRPNEQSQTGKGGDDENVTGMLAEFSNCVTHMEKSFVHYDTPQDTRSFRAEMGELREKCIVFVRELDKIFKKRGRSSNAGKHDAYDTRCEHAVFTAVVHRWQQIGTRCLSAERQQTMLAASFKGSSFLEPLNSPTGQQPLASSALQAHVMQTVDVEGEIQQETLRELRFYDQEITDIRDMMLDIGIQVEADQEELDVISERIERTSMNIEEVVDELEKCEELNRSISRKRCCCYVAIAVALLVAIGIVVLLFVVK